MLIVGLTGGIGAGKSAAARRFAERGAVVIGADALAREVVEPGTPGLAAIVAEFGPEMVDAEGRLDRSRLGGLVFRDEVARRRLEAITHPLIGARRRELVVAAPAEAIVVHDVPLLVEGRSESSYDAVVVVQAPVQERVRRLRDRGLAADDIERRIAAQASDDARRAVATYLIENDGSLADLDSAVDRVWSELVDIAAGRRPQP
jgi:dephospho-CoA kinase